MEEKKIESIKKTGSHKKMLIAIVSSFLALSVLPTFIYLPIKHLDNYSIERSENRAVNEFPTTFSDDYGKRIDDFVNDHSPFRGWLMNMHNYIDTKMNAVIQNAINKSSGFEFYDQACIGKDGWMFLTAESELEYYAKANIPSQKELEQIYEKIEKVAQKLKDLGKKFEIVICPNKSTIYPEFMPSTINVPDGKNRVEVIVDYLKNHNCSANFVYLKDELMSHKENEKLYYKQDTHWMPNAAYYGGQTIFKTVGKELKEAVISPIEKSTGDLCPMTHRDYSLEDSYSYTYRPEIVAEWKEAEHIGTNEKGEEHKVGYLDMHSTNTSNSNLFIVRDSFSENLQGIIEKEYTNCTYVHTHSFNRSIVDSDQFKNSDTVILESIERAETILYNNVLGQPSLLDAILLGLEQKPSMHE